MMGKRLRTAARRALALALALLLATGAPLRQVALAEAAGRGGAYLSEVRVAVAKTPQKAAEALAADGWEVLRGPDGDPADLNEGADAALKSTRAVVLGYRTTGEAAEGITDLAVMSMGGGYSLSDYRQLMDRYRDSQVRPFIERFMATVAEYRANAGSDDPGSRARAEMARALLNRIVDDDTGGRLGDLLLEPTRAELGDAYGSLPEGERARHIDLETALMQGDAATVAQAERLLSLAADSSGTTWLERLSALGPDGLADAGARPADARAGLAASYQDLAVQLSDGWEDVRAALLAQGAADGEPADADAEPADADAAGDATEPGAADAAAELGGRGDAADDAIVVEGPAGDDTGGDGAPLVIEGETEAPVALAPAPDAPVALAGEDEADLAELVRVDPPEPAEPADPESIEPEDVPQIVDDVTNSLGAMAESVADVSNVRNASIAAYLQTLPYGDGTLYDLFTRPSSEVTGDNIGELYPAASCLSEGQAAAIEFLPLAELLQVGATTGDAIAEVWTDETGLAQTVEATPEVSLYEGVDREMFGGLTALTSDAMRADALRTPDTGVVDFLSTYRRSALLWTGTAVAAIVAGASACKASRVSAAAARAEQITDDINLAKRSIQDAAQEVNKTANVAEGRLYIQWINKEAQFTNGRTADSVYRITYTPKYPNTKGLTAEQLWKMNDEIKDWETQYQVTKEVPADYIDLKTGRTDYSGKVDGYIETIVEPVQKQSKVWGTVTAVAGVVFFALTVASIISTVADVVAYYNVDFAPIPGYVVDVSDITQVAEDGTITVVRNDRAYYRAATTDARREGKDLEAMGDYADLNGDGGKEWLALYAASRDGQAPILADSLRVVTGTASVPDGYETGIHHFGEDSAANLTDARFSYNDDAGGVYAYFRRDEGAATAAGSAFAGGSYALVGGLCLVVGAAAGAGVTFAVGRRRNRE